MFFRKKVMEMKRSPERWFTNFAPGGSKMLKELKALIEHDIKSSANRAIACRVPHRTLLYRLKRHRHFQIWFINMILTATGVPSGWLQAKNILTLDGASFGEIWWYKIDMVNNTLIFSSEGEGFCCWRTTKRLNEEKFWPANTKPRILIKYLANNGYHTEAIGKNFFGKEFIMILKLATW